jgi:RNA polymerase sigma factor (sigma-70 family)
VGSVRVGVVAAVRPVGRGARHNAVVPSQGADRQDSAAGKTTGETTGRSEERRVVGGEGAGTAGRLARFEANRSRLLGLAYRMLGEAAEAEDVVQDAYLRWEKAGAVAVPEAWLAKVVANLCLNRLTSARVRREHYVGSWLPEPVLAADSTMGPSETAEQRHSLSLGMLRLLERLTPPERLAFVLREAFAYSHREVAAVLGADEAYARQLHHRARVHVGASRRRLTTTPEQAERIVEGFLAASLDGDVARLERLLSDDVEAWFDGGGRVGVARPPVIGRANVARYLVAWTTHPRAAHADITTEAVNAQPAILVRERGGLSCVIVPELGDGGIVAVYTIANPDKLAFAAAQLA